jgi:hypothetical protein
MKPGNAFHSCDYEVVVFETSFSISFMGLHQTPTDVSVNSTRFKGQQGRRVIAYAIFVHTVFQNEKQMAITIEITPRTAN